MKNEVHLAGESVQIRQGLALNFGSGLPQFNVLKPSSVSRISMCNVVLKKVELDMMCLIMVN